MANFSRRNRARFSLDFSNNSICYFGNINDLVNRRNVMQFDLIRISVIIARKSTENFLQQIFISLHCQEIAK